jgi:hypothetical protein
LYHIHPSESLTVGEEYGILVSIGLLKKYIGKRNITRWKVGCIIVE